MIERSDLRCERMDKKDALAVWLQETGKHLSYFSVYGSSCVAAGDQSVDHPLFSYGVYNGKLVLLLKEMNKCVVIHQSGHNNGIFLCGSSICNGVGLSVMDSRLDFIYREGTKYRIRFSVGIWIDGVTAHDHVYMTVGSGCATWGMHPRSGSFVLMSPREAFLC